jgi:hypothetical protein
VVNDDDRIQRLSARIRFVLLQPVDFRRIDTASTIAKAHVLTAAASYLNTLTITEHGGRIGSVRAPGMVEQIIGAVFQTFEDIDPHPDPFDKAAMLLRGVTPGTSVRGWQQADGVPRRSLLSQSYVDPTAGSVRPGRYGCVVSRGVGRRDS